MKSIYLQRCKKSFFQGLYNCIDYGRKWHWKWLCINDHSDMFFSHYLVPICTELEESGKTEKPQD